MNINEFATKIYDIDGKIVEERVEHLESLVNEKQNWTMKDAKKAHDLYRAGICKID